MSENSNLEQKLTPKQKVCIAALVDGKNYSQASMLAGVHTRTIARWRELPHFAHALKQAGNRSIADATMQITACLETAITFLLDVIQDADAPASVRTRAALGLIDRQIRLVETNDILERIEAIEVMVTGSQ